MMCFTSRAPAELTAASMSVATPFVRCLMVELLGQIE